MSRAVLTAVRDQMTARGTPDSLLPMVIATAEETLRQLMATGVLLPTLADIVADADLPSGQTLRDSLIVSGQLYQQNDPKVGRRTLKVVEINEDRSKATLLVLATESEQGRTGQRVTMRRAQLAGPDFQFIGYEPDGVRPEDYAFPAATDWALDGENVVTAAPATAPVTCDDVDQGDAAPESQEIMDGVPA